MPLSAAANAAPAAARFSPTWMALGGVLPIVIFGVLYAQRPFRVEYEVQNGKYVK